MTLRITNSTFQSIATSDFETVEDAYRAGVISGLRIATDEIRSGMQSAIVQVSVDQDGQQDVMRGAVCVSTARIVSPSALASARV